MREIKKIVLTGGPCAGKTEAIKHLENKYGEKVHIVPEVATMLLSIPYKEGGPGVPGVDLEYSREWADKFQTQVLKTQELMEREAERLASDKGVNLIICDRGTLDGAAYFDGGLAEFCEKFNLDEEMCLAEYDAVIHLNSLGTDNPELYEELRETNTVRAEDATMARKLDDNVGRAWQGHEQYKRIIGCESIEEKIKACEEMVEEILSEQMETTEEMMAEMESEFRSQESGLRV